MDTDTHRFLFKEETHQIIGCAMEVLNTLGHGLLENLYENVLCVKFGLRKILFSQQPQFDVTYKSVKVGIYVSDLINQIVVDTKTIDTITNHEKGQILNYLKITGLRVGLILNSKCANLQWERVVL